ncbi:tetratricopeptide repeat protein, partial [Micromonospora foliorum]|uniref:tetratricopeptide repeat protein n=1 Tax=Micromonospora foliorum TaxID=2911210 RepID=UPI001EE93B1A
MVAVDRWRARRHAEADREQLAIERLRQHTGRQKTIFPRIGEAPANALSLRIHPAAAGPPLPAAAGLPGKRRGLAASRPAQQRMSTVDPDLPSFVDRTKGPQIREWMRHARADGGFLLLVGDSCVGKTRLLYEAARQELPDFAVLAPDLGDGDLVNTIAEATFDLPKLIVWLDELQRFLPGPYLSEGSTPITAATIRRLLNACTPVIVMGTLWPTYAALLRADDPDPNHPDARLPRHPGAVDILTDRRIHETRIDTFTQDECAAAARMAAHDPRLATAVADDDYNVTEALAGARELTDRYERATITQRAVLHAAVDARRVGIQSALGDDLLREAARGYLSRPYPDDAWYPPALDELTSRERPQDKATAPLLAVSSSDQRTVIGYTVTDYLLQHLSDRRRTEPIPTLAWQAFGTHTHTRDELTSLADNATSRLRYDQALPLYQRLHDAGHQNAAWNVAHVLARQGRADELRTWANSGNDAAAAELALLLAQQGRVDELRNWADSGNADAAEKLARLLASQGVVDELWTRADAGDKYAAEELTRLLASQGRVDELREWADSGNASASKELARLLAAQGLVDELRARADAGDKYAARHCASLLAQEDRVDELRDWADSGNEHATDELTELLVEEGRVDELRDWADSGNVAAADELARLLVQDGRVDELR